MSRDKSFSWLLLKSLLEKKIDTTVLNTYGFQNSWQTPLSRSYEPFLFLSKVFVPPSHTFSTSSAYFLNVLRRSSYQIDENEKMGERFNCGQIDNFST